MTPEVQAAMEELAKWIDTTVIAETILDALNEVEIENGSLISVANGQKVWLDLLYTELGDAVKRSIEALRNKDELESGGEV